MNLEKEACAVGRNYWANEDGYWNGSWSIESRIAFVLFFGTLCGVCASAVHNLVVNCPSPATTEELWNAIRPLIPVFLLLSSFLLMLVGVCRHSQVKGADE